MSRHNLALVVVACVALLAPAGAYAHAGLLLADPVPGSSIGATPTAVRLTFSEKPEPSLSTISVRNSRGDAVQVGDLTRTSGDEHTLIVRVRDLGRGVYTVSWRVVSAVDGHATAGSYAFGVRASPAGSLAVADTGTTPGSRLELAARWIMILGLALIVGAAAASVARFGGPRDVTLGWVGFVLAAAGVALLAVAQYRTAGVSAGDLVGTPVGHALLWRALAVAVAGCALIVATRSPALRVSAMADAGIAAAIAMALDVSAGHAAAGRSSPVLTGLTQWAHFVAVGIWFGGLAALLLAVRGVATSERAAVVRRFSWIALACLVVVATTGVLRAVAELSSWNELTSTGYGRAILAKVALLGLIAGIGAVSLLRGMPASASDLGVLRRTSTVELGLAAVAVGVAALLGTLAPPAAERSGPEGLSVSGADLGTNVRVRLVTAGSQPGPNRFELRVRDYDTNRPVSSARVTLGFTALDDPEVTPTTLRLAAVEPGMYAGSGSNLSFDGRWLVTATIRRGARSEAVPLELEAQSPPRFVAVLRPPGEPPSYTIDLGQQGSIRISPDPERAGRSRLYVSSFDLLQNERSVDAITVTSEPDGSPTRRLILRRLSPSSFVADVDLAEGRDRIAVIERSSEGSRVRATFDVDVPGS